MINFLSTNASRKYTAKEYVTLYLNGITISPNVQLKDNKAVRKFLRNFLPEKF